MLIPRHGRGHRGRAGGEEYELSLIAVKNEVERILSAGYCHVSSRMRAAGSSFSPGMSVRR
jgi:hypothetical protein